MFFICSKIIFEFLFNDMSTLAGNFVPSPREIESNDRKARKRGEWEKKSKWQCRNRMLTCCKCNRPLTPPYHPVSVGNWPEFPTDSLLVENIFSFTITKTCLFKYIENFTTKKWKFPDEKFWHFSYFCSKQILWVLVWNYLHEVVLMSTH